VVAALLTPRVCLCEKGNFLCFFFFARKERGRVNLSESGFAGFRQTVNFVLNCDKND
jgi:hypothetical protein